MLFGINGHYDACIIDCPPTMNNLVVGAWQAARHIVTPVRLDSFDLTGVQYFAECLRRAASEADNHWSVVTNFSSDNAKGIVFL